MLTTVEKPFVWLGCHKRPKGFHAGGVSCGDVIQHGVEVSEDLMPKRGVEMGCGDVLRINVRVESSGDLKLRNLVRSLS